MSSLKDHIISDSSFIECKICNEKLEKIDGRHLKKHNTNIIKYKEKYLNEPTITKEKMEKELISLHKRRIGILDNKNKKKDVPCYFHNDRIISVNINSPKFGLCEECKTNKKILPSNQKSIDNMKKTIQNKYGVSNISEIQSIKDKKKLKWEEKTIEEKLQITKRREKTIENIYGENWKKDLNKLSKQGMIQKYGVEHALQIEEFSSKFSDTWNNKSIDEKKEITDKIKSAKLLKFGNSSYNNIDKIKETNKERYGGNSPTCNSGVIKKRQNNNLKKYGVKETLSVPEIRKKISNTNSIEGWPLQRPEVKEKIKEIYIKKYNVDHFMKSDLAKEKFREREIKKFLPKLEKLLNYLNLELLDPEYLGAHVKHNFKCKICNTQFTQIWNAIQQYYQCPTCFPRNNGKSKGEDEVAKFIEDLNFQIIRNSRTIIPPFELDIYLPEKKIAIEYCGLYYHSEEFLEFSRNVDYPSMYHYKKLELCKKIGIKLITIFEDEWIYKKDIVMKRLEYMLNKFSGSRINGRDCEIKEVDYNTKNNFLETYHIQGKDNSNIPIGAYYDSNLVSIMTFSKGNVSKGSSFKEGVWELNRFCTNFNYIIPGISSRLLEYFKKNYNWNEIYSYADRRWSSGELYVTLGFVTDEKIRLNYWYVKNYKRIHRFNLRKKPDEPKDISEKILRLKEGYSIVWDCGNLKFILKK
jgi:hypothetical protein